MVEAKDIGMLLAFFGLYNNDVNGRTRIQKDICILKYERGVDLHFDFEAHYYGPFSAELSDTVDTLVAVGLLEEKIQVLPTGVLRYDYGLTEAGKQMSVDLIRSLKKTDPKTIQTIQELIINLKDKPIGEVVKQAKACSGIQSTL